MNERIYIVDDEKEIADLIAVYLQNDGYTVETFGDGASALARIEEQPPALAILDIMLPDMDGFQICGRIREHHFFPLIMLTARTEDTDKILGLTIGADDYITKPFNPLELIARVKTQLRRYVRYNPGESGAQSALQERTQCELECPPDLMMKCDPGKLQRVLDNLLRNAVAYCYTGSCVKISVETGSEKTGSVTLRFTNQGDTIPPQKLSRIFEQFYRLDSSRSSSSGGSGLGLAIAKQIIELHHGSIAASSRDEVTGFTVVLPSDPEYAEETLQEKTGPKV